MIGFYSSFEPRAPKNKGKCCTKSSMGINILVNVKERVINPHPIAVSELKREYTSFRIRWW